MKKFLLPLVLLFSCNKENTCKQYDPIVDLMVLGINSQLDCDAALVKADLDNALAKLKLCNMGLSSINGGSLQCTVLPMFLKSLGDTSTAKWKCKNAGGTVSDVLKKALKCE